MQITSTKAIGAAALAAGVIAIGAAFAASSGGGSDDAPASAAADTSGCALEIDHAVMAMDPAVGQAFAAQGVGFRTIAPGRQVNEGLATSPKVHSWSNVACDFSSGFVGLRGGFRVENEFGPVEFRRFRVRLDDGEMDAFWQSTGPTRFDAMNLDMDAMQVTEQGTIVTAVIPMTLDHGGATAVNGALRTQLPSSGFQLGTLTITGHLTQGGGGGS